MRSVKVTSMDYECIYASVKLLIFSISYVHSHIISEMNTLIHVRFLNNNRFFFKKSIRIINIFY